MISSLEVRKKVNEAMESGRYLITITYMSKDGKTVHRHYTTQNFPRAEIAPALENLANDLASETDPQITQIDAD